MFSQGVLEGHTALPPSNQPGSKLIRPRPQLIRSIYQELVPVGHILLELTETEEASVSHPGRMPSAVAGSIAEDDTLRNRVLSGRNRGIDTLYSWFANAIKEPKAVPVSGAQTQC